MVARGERIGDLGEKGEGWEVQIGGYKTVMGNIVSNVVITMYGASWVLEISEGTLCKIT